MTMRQNWILIGGLIMAILLSGCTSAPPASPGVPTTQPGVSAPQVTPSPVITPGTIAKTGDTVSVFYSGSLDNGTVFDTNANGAALTFTLGKGMVIPGFEAAVLGMKVNESKTVVIPSAEAYGAYDPSRIYTVNRSVSNDMIPVVGMQITVRRTSDGAIVPARIVKVTDTTFTYDENSALAGENLTFLIRLAAIK